MSIDAAGCRKDIARTIATAGGWYLLAVKDNESHLHAHLQRDFAYLDRTGAVAHDRCETVERAHGRTERRTCTIMGGDHGILDEIDPDRRWAQLGCVVRVVAERTVRHCITNLPVTTGAARMADLVRGHWRVENSLHWVLDDTFQEDRCRLRTGHAARNMAALRRIALNFLTLLQQYFWPNMSIRRLPGWWPATPRDWNRSWPCDDFVNALLRSLIRVQAERHGPRGRRQRAVRYYIPADRWTRRPCRASSAATGAWRTACTAPWTCSSRGRLPHAHGTRPRRDGHPAPGRTEQAAHASAAFRHACVHRAVARPHRTPALDSGQCPALNPTLRLPCDEITYLIT